MDEAVRIIPYEKRFERDLVDICWRTGLMGESLEGTGRFEDRRLFGLLFCLQYPSLRDPCSFVAVAATPEGGERAVGYVLGAADTDAQRRDFRRRMLPRIAARLFLYDWWRHPESFRQALAFRRAERSGPEEEPAARQRLGGPDFPAHLHIDILPERQGKGIGSALMERLLGELKRRGCPGVFLGTSDRNLKALPFYRKLGFELVYQSEPGEFWLGLPAASISMAKRLS